MLPRVHARKRGREPFEGGRDPTREGQVARPLLLEPPPPSPTRSSLVLMFLVAQVIPRLAAAGEGGGGFAGPATSF